MSIFRKLRPYYAYLKPVWVQFTLGILLGVVYSISSGFGLPLMAETVFPILFGEPENAPEWMQSAVTKWFGTDPQTGLLILSCLLLPGMMLIRAISTVGNGYFMTYAGVSVVQAIQIKVFEKIQAMPLSFFQNNKTAAIMACIGGYPNQIKAVLVNTSNDLIRQPLTLLSAVGFLIYKSFTSQSFFAAVIGILSVPLVVFPIRRVGKYLAKRSRELVTLGEEHGTQTLETIQSPVEIRAYNLEKRQNERFVSMLREIFGKTMKQVRTKLITSPAIEVVASAGLSLSLFLGVRSGMGLEEFLALAIALYMAYSPVKRLGNINGQLRMVEAPLDRLEQILNTPDTIVDPVDPVRLPDKLTGEIRFQDVTFEYVSGTPVLNEVNITVHPGDTVALVGPSGSGKSTFANLIPRFFDVASGSITIDGIDVRKCLMADLRSQIAYVPQTPLLFNTSIRENIRVGRMDATDDEIEAAAKHAFADEFIVRLPSGYDTVLSERGNSLSGGQRQRIAVARAFLRDAPILIMDEATSALDPESDRMIQEALKKLTQDRTTLIISHRKSSVEVANRVLRFSREDGVREGDLLEV